ncbi:MAG: AIM24 family protein [Chloroflexi bacterium]|nr:AIM24 family protein [Chloroflexota bacterium]
MCAYQNQQPQPPQPPQHPTAGAGPQRSYACPWCGMVSDGTTMSCPACGAPVDVKAIATKSGWYELPGIKDMAKLQFGNSHCQIEGTYVPVADMNLAAEDNVYFTHHVLLWKDPQVNITTMPMRGGWKRMFAGLPLIMAQAHGPGHIAFSYDGPGELVTLPLQPGQAMDVREHIFMVATGQVTYDWFNTNIWFTTHNGDEHETNYPIGMFMDRFYAPQVPGLVLIHGAGNVFVRRLQQGETILVKPTALLFKDMAVQMQLHIEKPGGTWKSWRSWGERHLWLRLYGPGRVAIQSAFKQMEDNGNTMVNSSPASSWSW